MKPGVSGGELAAQAFPCRFSFAPGEVPLSCGHTPFDNENGYGGCRNKHAHSITVLMRMASFSILSMEKVSTYLHEREVT